MAVADVDNATNCAPIGDATIYSPHHRLPPKILTIPLPHNKLALNLEDDNSRASNRRMCVAILIATCLSWIGIATYFKYGPSMPYGSPAHSILVFLVFCSSLPIFVLPFLLFEEVRNRRLSPLMLGLLSYPTVGAFFGPFLSLLTLPPLLLVMFARRMFPNDKAMVLPALFLGVALDIVGVIVIPHFYKKLRRPGKKIQAEEAPKPSDPIVLAVYQAIESKGTKPRQIAQTLDDLGVTSSDRATLVCAGICEIPQVSDSRFEPEVFPASRRQSSNLIVMTVWPVILLFLAGLSAFLPWRPLSMFSGFARPGWLGAIVWSMILGPWIIKWIRSILYPVYVRLAPGVIQIIKYNWIRKRPLSIRSYPMTAGTTIVAHSSGKQASSFSVARGELEDNFVPDDDTDDGSGLLMRTWHAILSTAPTPPLSESHLVG